MTITTISPFEYAARSAYSDGEPGYQAVHWRLRQDPVPISSRPCAHCGAASREWAYDHDDPEELSDERYGAYSLDPAHYLPMCHSCHKRFDAKEYVAPLCRVEGCEWTTYRGGHGWCSRHYGRWRRYGDPLAGGRMRRLGLPCASDGCDKPVSAQGLCVNHYAKWRRRNAAQ